MACSFGTSPRIMRLFCTGKVIEKGNLKFDEWVARTGIKEGVKACRAVIVLDIFKGRRGGVVFRRSESDDEEGVDRRVGGCGVGNDADGTGFGDGESVGLGGGQVGGVGERFVSEPPGFCSKLLPAVDQTRYVLYSRLEYSPILKLQPSLLQDGGTNHPAPLAE
ncbi:hypothetical protein MPH_03291 [Macrophomina phaseolina MS6]|uniref:Uncharacterized protein n=1 Tax=Macrophomina phaseolina (strain MS6) TaxID=1126212 RepID=K2RXD5_MACPH|nr:hypothetical protein MPH_03291 [Macrophomina phaseolina MS6]